MNAEDFVSALRNELMGDLLNQYKEIYKSPHKEATDSFYKESITLYNSLNGNQRDILFSIKRQVIVDTISSMLAIIDGISMLSVQDEMLELKEKGGPTLSGELQDIFLVQEENLSER